MAYGGTADFTYLRVEVGRGDACLVRESYVGVELGLAGRATCGGAEERSKPCRSRWMLREKVFRKN